MNNKKFLLPIILLFNFSMSFAGVKEGGGGILASAEFVTAGRNAIQILAEGDENIHAAPILNLIMQTKVIPVDNICYTEPVLNKPYCEDAHYDKLNNVILFDISTWDHFNCYDKLVLSSHEFLRVAGLESEDYTFSGRFLSGYVANCLLSYKNKSASEMSECNSKVVLIYNRIGELCRMLRESSKKRNASNEAK